METEHSNNDITSLTTSNFVTNDRFEDAFKSLDNRLTGINDSIYDKFYILYIEMIKLRLCHEPSYIKELLNNTRFCVDSLPLSELTQLAVSYDGLLLEHIPSFFRTEDVILEAIKNNSKAIEFIQPDELTYYICETIMDRYPEYAIKALEYEKDINYAIRGVKAKPEIIKDIKRSDWSDTSYEKIVHEAIHTDPKVIDYVDNPTKDMCYYASIKCNYVTSKVYNYFHDDDFIVQLLKGLGNNNAIAEIERVMRSIPHHRSESSLVPSFTIFDVYVSDMLYNGHIPNFKYIPSIYHLELLLRIFNDCLIDNGYKDFDAYLLFDYALKYINKPKDKLGRTHYKIYKKVIKGVRKHFVDIGYKHDRIDSAIKTSHTIYD